MLAPSQEKALQDIAGAVFAPLGSIGDVLGLRIFRWLQDERLRSATIRELNRLNDDYLDDIGIERRDIRPIVNALVKRMRERRYHRRCSQLFACDLASLISAGDFQPQARTRPEGRFTTEAQRPQRISIRPLA